MLIALLVALTSPQAVASYEAHPLYDFSASWLEEYVIDNDPEVWCIVEGCREA